MSDYVTYQLEGAVATLTLDRPDKANAISFEMWAEIADCLDRLKADGARVLVIRSDVHDVFSAGADLDEFDRSAGDAAWRDQLHEALTGTLGKLMALDIPSLAIMRGRAIGAGAALALAADLRFGDNTARFRIPPAALGLLYPLQETRRLVDLAGPAAAKELLFTAKEIDATKARKMGLLNILVRADELDSRAEREIGMMAANSASSIAGSKQMIRMILEGMREETEEARRMFTDAYDGADFEEGIAAFREKRPPRYDD